MAHIYERVVNLISKCPEERHDRDIDLLISWFQNMSGLFKSQKTDVVKDIVRNCKFLSVPEDTVIIKQGDQGDSFFIILTGLVSIYINQQLEEQGNVTNSVPMRQRKRRSSSKAQRHANNNERQDVDDRTDSRGDARITPSETANDAPDDEYRKICDSGVSETSLDDTANMYDTSSSDSENSFALPNFKSDKLDRKQFGVHIRELGAGKSFGELALVQPDNVRSASIISDTATDLIVVNRDLYNRCLKTAQEMQFREKTEFVGSCSVFFNWTPRQRNVMAMSFTKTRYDYGNTIVKQGEVVRGMFFIVNGTVKHSVDPLLHVKQYPNYSSTEAQEFVHAVRCGKGPRDSKPCDINSNIRFSGPIHARRRSGYAEAEKHVTRKFIDICTVGASESIGDFEVVLRLQTYIQTVTCLGPVDVFELDLNNFERQVVKRSPKTYANMKELAQVKLTSRIQRLRDKQIYIPVMEKMLERIEEMNMPPKKFLRQKTEDDNFLYNQGWHKFRQKQRQFLRRRERERQLYEMKTMQMKHAANPNWHTRVKNAQTQQQQVAKEEALVLSRTRSLSDGATPLPNISRIPPIPPPKAMVSDSGSELSSDSGVALLSKELLLKPRSSSLSSLMTALPELKARPRTVYMMDSGSVNQNFR